MRLVAHQPWGGLHSRGPVVEQAPASRAHIRGHHPIFPSFFSCKLLFSSDTFCDVIEWMTSSNPKKYILMDINLSQLPSSLSMELVYFVVPKQKYFDKFRSDQKRSSLFTLP